MNTLIKYMLLLTLVVSCIKSNVNDINITHLQLNPEFAFPIGESTIKFKYYDINFEKIDTNLIAIDSILDSAFLYNQSYYHLPEELHYNISIAFSLSDYKDSSEFINCLKVKTNIISEIPGDVTTQVYFMHGFDTLEKLYSPNALQISGARVSGGSILPTDLISRESKFKDPEVIGHILETDTLLISTSLQIPSIDSVALNYTDSLAFWVQVAARITFNIKF